jgi:hypothetical protein
MGETFFETDPERGPFKLDFQSAEDLRQMGRKGSELTVKARARLQYALAILNHRENWPQHHVQRYAKRYFLIDALTDAIANAKIKPTLELTWNGLNSDGLRIAVKRQIDNTDPDGGVERNLFTRGKGDVKSLEDGFTYRYDVINIATRMLSNEDLHRNAVQTIIHEATHKYAGTWDYCYFDAAGEKPTTPYERGLVGIRADKRGFVDGDAAMQNADSFAWFAYKISRRPDSVTNI